MSVRDKPVAAGEPVPVGEPIGAGAGGEERGPCERESARPGAPAATETAGLATPLCGVGRAAGDAPVVCGPA